MLWAIIAILIAALDQIVKQIVISKIPYGEIIPVIDKFFYLTYHENKGAAWGFFQNGRIFFIVLTLLISIVIVYMIAKSKDKLLKLSLAVILGGALGNFIDRVLKGGVGDFLDFHIFSYHFPTFNVADMFVVIGTILLAIYLLFIYKEPVKEAHEGVGVESTNNVDNKKEIEIKKSDIDTDNKDDFGEK